jgi:hypothetical protein
MKGAVLKPVSYGDYKKAKRARAERMLQKAKKDKEERSRKNGGQPSKKVVMMKDGLGYEPYTFKNGRMIETRPWRTGQWNKH